jgi:hypothetical protein
METKHDQNDQTALVILLPNISIHILLTIKTSQKHLKNPQNISKLCAFLFLLFLSLSGLGGTFSVWSRKRNTSLGSKPTEARANLNGGLTASKSF